MQFIPIEDEIFDRGMPREKANAALSHAQQSEPGIPYHFSLKRLTVKKIQFTPARPISECFVI